MSNQHTGAPVLKGGLLQCYQLQARVYGGLALRPRQGPGLLNAAPRLPDLRRLPVRHRLLCAAATGRGRQRGGRNQREKPCFSCSPFASVYRKGCPALQVRRCICAFMALHDEVLQKARLLSTLLFFYSPSRGFDLWMCVGGCERLCVCFCCCTFRFSWAAPG